MNRIMVIAIIFWIGLMVVAVMSDKNGKKISRIESANYITREQATDLIYCYMDMQSGEDGR